MTGFASRDGGNDTIVKRNQEKRPRDPPERDHSGSDREAKRKPRKRPGWMRDVELDRSINAAVQDGDYSDR
jgi:hypothetical protein